MILRVKMLLCGVMSAVRTFAFIMMAENMLTEIIGGFLSQILCMVL